MVTPRALAACNSRALCPLVHCRQQPGPAVMQETTVKDGVKFRFTDKQGVRRAPAVQGRTFAVGANRQDRRRGLLQRGALDKRAVDAQPGIAGEDKVGLSSSPVQATAAVRIPSFAALILAPAAVPAG